MSNDSMGPVEVEFQIPTDFERGLDSATNKMFTMTEAATRSSKEVKEAIKAQKDLISQQESNVKSLEKASQTVAPGNAKMAILGELSASKSKLAREQAALVGLQKEQTLANEAEKASQGGLVSSLGKWAIGLMSVTAALKIGKAIIESTETTAHSFEQIVGAATSGVGYFFKSIASGDFSNFQTGLSIATKGATDFVDVMEDVHRLINQAKIKGSDIDLQIAGLREKTWDKSAGNYNTRINALSKIIELTNEKNSLQVPIAEKNFDAILKKTSTDTGGKLSTKEIMTLVGKYDNLKDIKELGDQVNKLNAVAAGGGNTGMYKGNTNAATDAIKKLAELGDNGRVAGQLATRLGLATSSAMDEIANAYSELNKAKSTLEVGSKFDQRQFASAKNALKDERAGELKRQSEYDQAIGKARLDNNFEIEQELLNAQKDSAEKSRAQADLDYRKTLNDLSGQRTEALKKYNYSPSIGGIDIKTGQKTGKYTDKLPEIDQKQFDDKAIAAVAVKESKITEINRVEAEKIKEIQREIEDYRLTGIEKEKAAVAKKYDDMDRIAKDPKYGDPTASAKIAELRAKANQEIDNKYALESIGFQEQLETRKNEIIANGVNRDEELQKLNFETWKKYQQKKIDILKSSPNTKDQEQAQLLEVGLIIEDNNKKLENEKKIRDSIFEASQQLTDILVKNGQLSDQQAVALNGALSMLSKAASGDWIGAGMAFVGNFVNTISSAFGGGDAEAEAKAAQDAYDKLSKSMEALASALDRQQKAIDRSFGTDKITAFDNAILISSNNLKQVTKDLNDYIQAYNKTIPTDPAKRPRGDTRTRIDTIPDIISTTTGSRGGQTVTQMGAQVKDAEAAINKLYEKLNSENLTDAQSKDLTLLLDNYEKYYDDLLQREKAKQEFLTGSTESSISSSIIDGFKNGYKGAADFSKNFEDLMRTAVLNSLNLSVIEPELKKWQAEFAAAMEDNQLTADEKEALKRSYDAMVENSKKKLDELEAISGVDVSGNSQSAKQGSFQSMSQDTGTELLGQFTALRMSAATTADLIRQDQITRNSMKASLLRIEENTEYCRKLDNMDKVLTRIETNGIKVR